MKEHETWWNNNIPQKLNDFSRWLKNENSFPKRRARSIVRGMKYKSLLDVGAGLCSEFYGYKKDYPELNYMAMDITPKLVSMGKEKGVNIIEGTIERIPFPNCSFDIVYARSVFEHFPRYENAMNECIRVCKKESMITFFLKPHNGAKDEINWNSTDKLYNNRYSKKGLIQYLKKNKDVKYFIFDNSICKDETLLRIFKTAPNFTSRANIYVNMLFMAVNQALYNFKTLIMKTLRRSQKQSINA